MGWMSLSQGWCPEKLSMSSGCGGLEVPFSWDSHTNSGATPELQPLAAEGRTQQRNFQKKEFWWELISEATSL